MNSAEQASNMNYGLMLSCEVEKLLAEVDRHEKWTQDDEAAAYNKALMEVAKKFPDAWMDGNIRVGDYILLSKDTSQSILRPSSNIVCFSRQRHSGPRGLPS